MDPNAPIDASNQQKKKLAIIAGIAVGVFFLMVLAVSLFMKSRSGSVLNEKQQFVSQSSVTPTRTTFVTNIPEPSISIPQSWLTKSTGDVQISFPSDWYLNDEVLANGGYAFNLSPSFPPDGVIVKNMSLQVFPKPQSTLDSLEAAFKALGYTQTPLVMGSIKATEFKGSINAPSGKLFESVILFEDSKNIYRFIDTYTAESRSAQMDALYNSVAKTIRLVSPKAQ